MRSSGWLEEGSDLDRSLAVALARIPNISIDDDFWRHASKKEWLLSGSLNGGRWGPPGAFPVTYLGQPAESVMIEAYRNLVDPVEGMSGDLVGPRWFGRLRVTAERILDLRDTKARMAIGLTPEALSGSWEECQRVGQAAHQLEMHGLLVPAATETGLTLAIFDRHLSPEERPRLVEAELWDHLPIDPRRARLAAEEQESPSPSRKQSS